eukprot:4474200-Amphidinium_carterae.1
MLVSPCQDYHVGDDVFAQSGLDGKWYAGAVEEVQRRTRVSLNFACCHVPGKDVFFRVRWDSPVGGALVEEVHAMYMEKAAINTRDDYLHPTNLEARVFQDYTEGDRILVHTLGGTIEAVVSEAIELA